MVAPKSEHHNLTVKASEEGFSFWLRRSYLSDETKQSLAAVNFLLVPFENVPNAPGPVFTSEARNLLEFLEQEATPNIRIGIAINEADFREILQRSRRVSLGKIVLASVVVPTAINLLSNYIQRKCIDRAEEASVHVELVVTRPDGESILIKFDGPAEKLSTVISQAVEENSRKRPATRNDSAGEACLQKQYQGETPDIPTNSPPLDPPFPVEPVAVQMNKPADKRRKRKRKS